MRKRIATYTLAGKRHRIELVDTDEGTLLLDRTDDGQAGVVAELALDEGEEQARAVLDGDGAYLERARAGEPGLCRPYIELPEQAEAA